MAAILKKMDCIARDIYGGKVAQEIEGQAARHVNGTRLKTE